MHTQKKIYREMAVAGQFYPDNPDSLKKMLQRFFEEVAEDAVHIEEHIAALVVPHAGYVFSGLQAAKAYYYLKNRKYKLVCIISPSHREYFEAISIYPGEGYRTPLGDLQIDDKAREIALQCEAFHETISGHRAEHALEVQLPFLQYLLKDFSILPLVMGDQGKDSVQAAAECVGRLYREFGKDILFVASTDLSHFHSANEAETLDRLFISLLEDYQDKELEQALQRGNVEACGGGPLLAILRGLPKDRHFVHTLGYRHSGQVNYERREVVGYTSALILEKSEK